jgi:glycosyltransferase involved in cell wall biosynthesis
MGTDRLKVLHVGKFYPPAPGGMETVVQLLCEGARERIDSRVLVANTASTTRREDYNGIQVTRVGSFGAIGSVGLCPAFPLELGRAQRDVTVIHEPNPVALVSDWLAGGSGPLLVWFHSEVLRPAWKYRLLYRPFLRRVLQRATRIAVSSPRLVEHAAELRDFRDKCVVIPFGVEPSRFVRTPDLEPAIHAIEATFPGPRLFFVGRLVPYKGVEVLIRAMQTIDATAIIAGEGPERDALAAEVMRLGVGGRVRLVGRLSDAELLAHLHACDFFVLPSVTSAETFGVVQLEAMACGKPVISTNLPTGVPWVNRDGDTGFVVPPRDHSALAEAMAKLLKDSGLRRRMGEAARARVREHFTVKAMAHGAAALYEQVAREADCRSAEQRASAASVRTDAR